MPEEQNSSASTAAEVTREWFSPRRFAVVLGLLLLVSFSQVWFGLATFAHLDFGQFAYPVAFRFHEAFWRGEIPLWNPLSSCGTPFLAQWNTMTLYPLSLFYLLLPLPWSLNAFCLLHLLLAGMGMYFLAQSWTNHRLAAALAGVTFAYNGLTWFGLVWPHVLTALAWMPWVILAMERTWERGRRWVFLAALIAGLQLLTGGAEVIVLTWLIVAALVIDRVMDGKVAWRTLAGRTGSTAFLAAGIAAAQLLPFLSLLAHSQRNRDYGASNVAAMPLGGWANYLVPLFQCLRTPQGLFVPPKYWTASYYLGVAVVFLAVLTLVRKPVRRVRILWITAGFGLLMALGGQGFVYDLFTRAIPLLGFMRCPVKFVILPTFILPALAACGLAYVMSSEHWQQERRRLLWLATALLGVTSVILGISWVHPAPEVPFSTVAWNTLLRALLLAAVLGCIFVLRQGTELRYKPLLQVGLISLLWLDVRTHNGNLSPVVPPQVFEPNALRQFYHWDAQTFAGGRRLMENKMMFGTMMNITYPDLVKDIAGRRLAQFFDFNLLDHVPKFDGFYSLDLKEFSQLLNRVYYSTNRLPPRLLDFTGVSRINNPTNLTDWMARPSAYPMITAGQQVAFKSNEAVLQAVLDDGFAPGRVVYLPEEAQGKLKVGKPVAVRINLLRLSAQDLEFEVDAEGPTIVVIAQSFYHPWHAYVDDDETTVWRANFAFQALESPVGKHHVRLVYEDGLFHLGLALSGLSLVFCAAGWWYWKDE